MAENLNKVPKRGILKQSSSFEHSTESVHKSPKEPHFDESNILATLHPPDKDYGFMKIDEPKTPYGTYDSDDDSDTRDELDANLLAAKIAAEGHKGPRPRKLSEPSGDEEDLALLTPEEREARKKFEQKRKAHYNEFHAVKMARALMQDEVDEEEEDEVAQQLEGESKDGGSGKPSEATESTQPDGLSPPANHGKSSPMDTDPIIAPS